MTNASKPSPHYAPERESRVADALRENLRKRKQQVQSRLCEAQSSRAQTKEAQTRATQDTDTNSSKDS